MKVDNFEQIKKHMNCQEGEFFLCQIIQRGKDQPNGVKSMRRTIRSYYISSPEYLDTKKEDIQTLCEKYNARAYINLNKKSKRQVCLKSLETLAHMVAVEDYGGLFSLIDTACGQTGSCDGKKTWIVDVDTKDENELKDVMDVIIQCEPFDVEKIVDIIPTLHGYHIITRPFNKKRFRDFYNETIDIHDNNPTLLYFNQKYE